jgi:hypothetical protein
MNRLIAGKVIECRACGRWVKVPGQADPVSPPRPAPKPEPEREPPREETWTSQAEEDYGPPVDEEPAGTAPPSYIHGLSSFRARWPAGGRPNAPVNRIVASVGAALVFIALFLPMVSGPGLWLSFIDVPWKAVTVGFALVDEVTTRHRSEPEPAPRGSFREERRERAEPSEPVDPRKSAQAGLIVLVGIGSVLYPLFVLAVLGFAGYQIATGRSARGYTGAGIVIAAATVLYAVGLLLLNSVPEMRRVMVLVSPGFGWAVLLVGAAALSAAGLIRLDPRTAA